jgi:hypothetical protein
MENSRRALSASNLTSSRWLFSCASSPPLYLSLSLTCGEGISRRIPDLHGVADFSPGISLEDGSTSPASTVVSRLTRRDVCDGALS